MSKNLLIRCSCGVEIFAWMTIEAVSWDPDEQHWVEIVTTYKPRGLRQRIQAFRGRYAEAVIVENADAQKIRDFLNEVVS